MSSPSASPEEHTLQVQTLYVRHHPAILAYVLAMEPGFADAQDIVQEVFLTLTRKAHAWTPGTQFMAWACTIARYHTLHFQRTRSRRVARLDDDVVELLHPAPSLDEAAFQRRLTVLQACMAKLAPRSHQIVMLRYHHGQMPEKIAETVGWSVNAVRVALSRARQALRECLDRRLALGEIP
jgi:RNA polymerase sigma-70 factor (ECF subfamily)